MPLNREKAIGTDVDPVRLEIFNNLFMAIAEEMGVALQSTATSVNIKERLDFSCAIFDRDGALIANAPHIPVHLGSMGESIRTIIDTRGKGRDGRGIRRGDAYVLNDPYRGGTHLPDITVIVPVFYSSRNGEGDHEVVEGAACRAPTPLRQLLRSCHLPVPGRICPTRSSPRAVTMPTSAESRRARCRPTAVRSRTRGC